MVAFAQGVNSQRCNPHLTVCGRQEDRVRRAESALTRGLGFLRAHGYGPGVTDLERAVDHDRAHSCDGVISRPRRQVTLIASEIDFDGHCLHLWLRGRTVLFFNRLDGKLVPTLLGSRILTGTLEIAGENDRLA